MSDKVKVNVMVNKPDVSATVHTTSPSINIPVEVSTKGSGDKHYTFIQRVPSDVWEVKHNLNKYPSVSIVDSANTEIIGDVDYIDLNNCRLTFVGAFSGKAYFN